MTISDHTERFLGFPVVDYDSNKGVKSPERTVYRVGVDVEHAFEEGQFEPVFVKFINEPGIDKTPGLIIGSWSSPSEISSEEVVDLLVPAAKRLKSLKGIFIGDITYEECEMSWIIQSDVSPVLKAFPDLELFRVRGGNKLSLGRPDHKNLKTLIVETGGLDALVVEQIYKANLPNLEHLELWLGVDDYGGTVGLADLDPLLGGNLFPNLISLGLRNSDFADEIALAIIKAPILNRLKRLDLSLGTLTDAGGLALLNSDRINKLEELNLRFNYFTEGMAKKLAAMDPVVDVGDRQDVDEEDRFPAVTE